ncbi:cytochrome P450 3A28 [Nephila pilipes]|uniref:Cytochrome P450 3A28 n=1 Tax=Nephila pilipes TaxID=299642 RepID=A0A8X6NHF5_NEPPI|nr:cytochrome P450 3A28 [Nephila pilipes]
MFGYNMITELSVIFSVLIGLFTAFYLYYTRNDNYWKKRGVHYVPRANPITLLWKAITKPITELLKEDIGKYGKHFGAFEFSTPVYVISDPDLLRDILVKDFHKFHYRRHIEVDDPITKYAVSLLEGEDWKRVRTVITPAFTSKRMRQMGTIINDCSKSVVEVCEKFYKEGKPVECRGMFGAFTMDVIAKVAFGTQVNSHNDPENTFVKHAKQIFQPMVFLSILFLLLPNWLLRKFNLIRLDKDNFFQNVIKKVMKERKESGKRSSDVLQILMDATDEHKHSLNSELIEDETDQFGSIVNNELNSSLKFKKLSEVELLSQCVLFFLVGYETTASTLTFLAFELAMNPEWQEELIKEVDKTFEKHSEMSYDTVRDMKVLDAVVSETLRKYPVAFVTVRTACEDYELGNTGVVLEKGMRVTIPIYPMHYDPENFEDPETFNPNRFMDPSEMKHPQYAYLPFGAGPRNCLGMRLALLELKVCVTNILRHFRFRRDTKTKVPLEYKKGAGLLSLNDLYLAVEKRTDAK